MEGFYYMEYIDYVYYNGVLKNLTKQLDGSSGSKESINRAIENVQIRLKEYENKGEKEKENPYYHNPFQKSYSFK